MESTEGQISTRRWASTRWSERGHGEQEGFLNGMCISRGGLVGGADRSLVRKQNRQERGHRERDGFLNGVCASRGGLAGGAGGSLHGVVRVQDGQELDGRAVVASLRRVFEPRCDGSMLHGAVGMGGRSGMDCDKSGAKCGMNDLDCDRSGIGCSMGAMTGGVDRSGFLDEGGMIEDCCLSEFGVGGANQASVDVASSFAGLAG